MARAKRGPGSYLELRMWSEAFAKAQEHRVEFENIERAGQVNMEAFAATVDLYRQAEENLRKEMVACYSATVAPGIRKWQQETPGIGESTLARLLGAVGDPRMAYPRHWEEIDGQRTLVEDPPHPRMVSQLWRYCGVGPVKNRDVKGNAEALMANGRPDAKMLLRLMAEAQVKSNAKGGAGYRHVYDAVKLKYRDRVHTADCQGGYSGPLYVKCKTRAPETPGGKPGYALAGDPFQPSHVHAIALRIVAKEILRDLWLAAGEEVPALGRSTFPHGGIYNKDRVFGEAVTA